MHELLGGDCSRLTGDLLQQNPVHFRDRDGISLGRVAGIDHNFTFHAVQVGARVFNYPVVARFERSISQFRNNRVRMDGGGDRYARHLLYDGIIGRHAVNGVEASLGGGDPQRAFVSGKGLCTERS